MENQTQDKSQYIIHSLGWMVFATGPSIMIMDDFGNAVDCDCIQWRASIID